MADKMSFQFPKQGAIPTTEYRVANALEFIAYYLGRIDTHLERLVEVTDGNGAGFPMLRNELGKLREAIEAKK